MSRHEYDVVIVGGGISGCSLLYLLSTFTNIENIGLLEKYDHLDPLNSNAHNNSQTLHCGDIETNYSLEKAAKVKKASDLTLRYVQRVAEDDRMSRCYGKMLLGVGEEECALVEKRVEDFKHLFPTIEFLGKSGISKIEPNVVKAAGGGDRPEKIAALHNPEGYAIDYGLLTDSFAEEAQHVEGKNIGVHLKCRAKKIKRTDDGFEIRATRGRRFHAKFIVISAGAHSLLIAQKMGYAHHLSVMPVTGNFFFGPKVLNGKVYTVQNDKLPFAAIHGDPDLTQPDKTRFGPTALVMPVLERHNAKTAWGFLESFRFDKDVASVLYHLMKDKDIHDFVYKNIGYEIPVFGKHSFLEAAQKIVPSMQVKDLEFAHGYTGIRPQIIDKKARQLLMGESKINESDGIIFNMTPSPGATSALANSKVDMHSIVEQLGAKFDEDAFESLFGD